MIALTRLDNGASVVIVSGHVTHFHTSIIPGKNTTVYLDSGLILDVREDINTVAKALDDDLD